MLTRWLRSFRPERAQVQDRISLEDWLNGWLLRSCLCRDVAFGHGLVRLWANGGIGLRQGHLAVERALKVLIAMRSRLPGRGSCDSLKQFQSHKL